MTTRPIIHAVVPVKDTRQAKQRLAGVLSGAQRQELALAMLEDVLAVLARVDELAGILVVTADAAAAAIAARYRAGVMDEGARDGHTGAVAAAVRRLVGDGMLAVPGDIPLLEPDDVRRLVSAHREAMRRGARAFIIAPARDEQGSNAVLCSPIGAVPLRFGEDSFFPHLAAARSRGIEPEVVRVPRIALDIDTPQDLALLLGTPARTRAHALLRRWRIDVTEAARVSA
jgi:2-phospho-L-lactate/phosphoenolpyruvate guanylyltransferase